MTIEQIIELGRMGYSKEDIEKLNTESSAVEKKETEKKESEKKETEKKETEKKESEKKEAENSPEDILNTVLKSIDSLTKSIQSANITNSNNRVEEKTSEMLLAEIIRPKRRGE